MRANFLGRSVVSAMTQTPASGPFELVTTPPISSLSMLTDVPCWLLSWLGHEAKKAAMPAATTPRYTILLVFTSCSFRCDPQFIGANLTTLRPLRFVSAFDAEEYRKMTGYVNVDR